MHYHNEISGSPLRAIFGSTDVHIYVSVSEKRSRFFAIEAEKHLQNSLHLLIFIYEDDKRLPD